MMPSPTNASPHTQFRSRKRLDGDYISPSRHRLNNVTLSSDDDDDDDDKDDDLRSIRRMQKLEQALLSVPNDLHANSRNGNGARRLKPDDDGFRAQSSSRIKTETLGNATLIHDDDHVEVRARSANRPRRLSDNGDLRSTSAGRPRRLSDNGELRSTSAGSNGDLRNTSAGRPRSSRRSVQASGGDDELRSTSSHRSRRLQAETLGNTSSTIHGGDDDPRRLSDNGEPRSTSAGRPRSSRRSLQASSSGIDDELRSTSSHRSRRLQVETLGNTTSTIHGGDDDPDEDVRTSRRRRLQAESLGKKVTSSIHGGDDRDGNDVRSTSAGRRRLNAETLGNVKSIHGGDNDDVDKFGLLSKRKSPGKKLQAEILGDDVMSIHSSSFEADSSSKSFHGSSADADPKNNSKSGAGRVIAGDSAFTGRHGTRRSSSKARSDAVASRSSSRSRNGEMNGGQDPNNNKTESDTDVDGVIVVRSKLVDVINEVDALLGTSDKSNNRLLRPVRSKLVEAFDEIGVVIQAHSDNDYKTNQQLVEPISRKLAQALDDLNSFR